MNNPRQNFIKFIIVAAFQRQTKDVVKRRHADVGVVAAFGVKDKLVAADRQVKQELPKETPKFLKLDAVVPERRLRCDVAEPASKIFTDKKVATFFFRRSSTQKRDRFELQVDVGRFGVCQQVHQVSIV